ncbi:MAG: YhcN/YlaJ family sporulation lipoprotein [Clostridiales bacterium]|nr:YhcN/YlaJ family sporulation lipoprotein [Clostridiales bacterium]
MKKLLLLTLLTIVLALTIGQTAFAETCEEKICKLATENEKVTEARCAIYERCCIVAIKTQKFTSKNEYDKFVEELTEKIKADCEVDHVFVTRNPKVMVQITKLADISESEREEAIKKLLDREMFRHKPDHKFVFPKRAGAEQ